MLRAFIFYTNVVDSAVEHGNADLGKQHNHSSLSLQPLMNSLPLTLGHVIHEWSSWRNLFLSSQFSVCISCHFVSFKWLQVCPQYLLNYSKTTWYTVLQVIMIENGVYKHYM